MIGKGIREKVAGFVRGLQRFAGRWWYPPLIGLVAIADNFVFIIPSDGILISSVLLTPRRWLWLALTSTFGSTVGALILAALVEIHGLPLILEYYPNLTDTATWTLTSQFFDQYGLYLVFLISMTPLMQQPVIILAGLALTPLSELAPVVFFGKGVKYVVLAYVGSHAPRLLKKLWGLKEELKEVGVKLE